MGLDYDTLRKAIYQIIGNLWLSQICQVKEATWKLCPLPPQGHQLTATSSKNDQKPHAKSICQPIFLHQAKYHHYDIYCRKGWRESLLWILFQTSGTKQNYPYNWTEGTKSTKMWASGKLPIASSLRLKLYTVMLWYCLVSSSVSHFAQLLSDKTGSRHSLFCMHSSSLKNIFIQLLR